MRVLEGRRSRLEERLERMRASLARTRERLDDYTLELQRHGMESVEREVRWLNELIETDDGPDALERRRPTERGRQRHHQPRRTAADPKHRRNRRDRLHREQPEWVRFA